ncbi:hypothetical protein CIB95_11735 [Lottiidibacillus patelloidae]|uniref:Replicative DNA helicase n=1 Tax=Lottiidibacillus patelloidae TaxID=2670334 RepID=A0A263BRV1_9BACI|nr:hypothetical protein [Lottiidibacillus patelloidae]OZM56439.1 hypothetical protein CIB95_11735 [Lottiidibacillus patelloidae]
MFNFLEGFQRRMEIVGIVESIVNRKKRNMEIERLFNDNDFINLVFSVLLFIMEKTLAEDSDCDSSHIQKFIGNILPPYYDMHLQEEDLYQLTQYILKNVLQNEGVAYHFQTIDYEQKKRKNIAIRLVADHVQEVNGGYKITYSLTDQGYDFLFRTKEVDQEIQITIEELKLKELIKRKNFKKAHNQSQNLIQMVRQKKKEIHLFMMKIKENIHDVDIDEYERLINSTYDLLHEEYELLSGIMDMARKSEEKIRQEYEDKMKLDESLKKAQFEIKQINQNIKATLSEQKDLIITRQSLSKVYIETIGDSFLYSMEKRFDFEELILKQMEQHVDKVEHFWKLVNPLFLPNIHQNMNIRSVYEPQGMIKLEEQENTNVIEKEVLQEDTEQERIAQINETYVEILHYLFNYGLHDTNESSLEEVIASLQRDDELFQRFCEDRLLFTTLLKLYDIGEIDLKVWRSNNDKVVMNLSEELNLDYCFSELHQTYEYMNNIEKISLFKKDNSVVEVDVKRTINEELQVLEKVTVSNFIIKVDKSGE